MRVYSLNIGRPHLLSKGGRTISTSINRKPTSDPVLLSPLGFEGDRPADTRVHGGPDKAVCCYPHEHYDGWREMFDPDLAVPGFGENLTTEGLLETDVCLGDVFQIGQATVQVTQPRQPCGTLAMKHECKMLPRWINERHFTGFYLRVLAPGLVRAGDAITRTRRGHADLTVARMNEIMLDKTSPVDVLERLVSLPELAEAWKRSFSRRLRAVAGESVSEDD